MWIPKTEEEIRIAAAGASLEETATFDAKREISAKSIDLAVDVAAMANTAGGVLLFGVGEDSNSNPTVLCPFLLQGQPERIDQIIRKSIDEVPLFNIVTLRTESDVSIGYIALVVPPSYRAPHMVIVKGDRRYYGRGEKGNFVLSQIEVARLYDRRFQSNEGILPLIEASMLRPPVTLDESFAHLHVIAQPVFRDEPVLIRALSENQKERQLLDELVRLVLRNELTGGSYEPTFAETGNWTREADGYLGKLRTSHDGDPLASASTLQLKVGFDGSCRMFCGRAAEQEGRADYPLKSFFAGIVAGNTSKCFFLLGELFRRAEYFGMVDLGVGLTGLKDCVPYEGRSAFQWFPRYQGADSYRRTKRTSAAELVSNPSGVASELLMPLIHAIFQESYDPFGGQNNR
jgi:hypothetical protein